MIEKINVLLTKQEVAKDMLYTLGYSLLGLIVLFLLVILLRSAYHINRLSDKSTHTFIKSIAIGIAPAIYFANEAFSLNIDVSLKVVILVTVAIALVSAVTNFLSFGTLRGFILTFAQCIYSALIVLGILSFTYAIVAIVIIGAVLLFGGSTSGVGSTGSTSSSRVPSHLRDPSTNETFYTTTGANGQPYVNRYGSDLPLHMTSYGRWMDSNGNEYV